MSKIKVEVVAKKAYYGDRMHKEGAIIEFNTDHMSTLKVNRGTRNEGKRYLPSWAKPVDGNTPVRKAYNPNIRPKETTLHEMTNKGKIALEAEKAAFEAEKKAFEKEKKAFEDSQKDKEPDPTKTGPAKVNPNNKK